METNPVASDSDVKSRIQKAEKRALKRKRFSLCGRTAATSTASSSSGFQIQPSLFGSRFKILEYMYLGVLLDSKKGILSIQGRRLRNFCDTIAYIFACMKVHMCVQARKLAFCRSGYFHVGCCRSRCIDHDALDQY